MKDSASRFPLRHLISLAIVVAMVAVAWIALSVPEPTSTAAASIDPASPLGRLNPQLVTSVRAHDFQLPDREGRHHSLSEHRGRPVVLNFWSTDCPPCLEELPSLTRLAALGLESGEFTVITVSVDSGWDEVGRLFPEGVTPPLVLFDPERTVVTGRYGTELFPETFLIDGQGLIRARFDGARNWSSPAALAAIRSL